jgi:hypothetical protein
MNSNLCVSDSKQTTVYSELYAIPETYLVFSDSKFDLILSSLKFKIAIFGFAEFDIQRTVHRDIFL